MLEKLVLMCFCALVDIYTPHIMSSDLHSQLHTVLPLTIIRITIIPQAYE